MDREWENISIILYIAVWLEQSMAYQYECRIFGEKCNKQPINYYY